MDEIGASLVKVSEVKRAQRDDNRTTLRAARKARSISRSVLPGLPLAAAWALIMGNASRIFLPLCPQCFAWQLQKEVPATEVSVGGWLAASCKQSTRSQRTRAPEIAGKAERSQQLAATEARGESCVSAASVENAQTFAGEGDSQGEVKKTSALPVSADSVLATLCLQQQLLQHVQQQRVLAQEAARAELRQMQQETLVEIKAAEAARIERLFEERKTHAAREKREFEESRTQSAQRASQEKMEEWPARSRSPSCGQQTPMTSFWRQRPQSRADAVPYAEPEWMRANREAGQRRQATAGGRDCPPGLQTSGNQSKTRKKRASAIRQNKTPRVESRAHLQQAYKTNQQRRSHAEAHEANQRRSWQDDESSES